ncbi:hypothetical protein M0805_006479 [Coniferiporia weirii]|nr:hypothetical protein M0805_006479 [Coniferiporia weirii]
MQNRLNVPMYCGNSLLLVAIEVNFEGDRPRFPVFLKIKAGDVSHKSVPFEEGSLVRWVPDSDLHITVPAVLVILVRQQPVQKYFKKDYAIFKIGSSQLIGNDTFSAPDGKGRATVTITCASALPVGLFAEFLLEEAEGQVGNKKVLLRSLGHAGRILDGLMTFSDLASDVHPAIGAAVIAINALYKKCKAQEDCRQAAAELVRDLVSFMPIVREIPQDDVRKTVTRDTIKKMLGLFCTISESIIKYSSGGILGDLFSDHNAEMDSAKAEFGKLKETYDWCVRLETWGSVARAVRLAEDSQLQRLRPALSAFYNAEGACLEGTRESVLRRVREWGDSESKLFWLHGVAGSGKSSIANSVAHIFKRQLRLSACFFCKGDDPECRSPNALIPTLAYHFSKWHNAYRSAVLSIIEGANEPELAQGLERQFDLLITQALTTTSSSPESLPPYPLIVVIDALDECGDSRSSRIQVAKLLVRLSSVVTWLKVFITSRTLPELDEVFLQAGTECEAHDINALFDHIEAERDILQYTRHCADRCQVKFREEQIQLLAKRASGLFIWTSTVFKYFDSQLDMQGAVSKVLSSLPAEDSEAELDQVYTTVIQGVSVGEQNTEIVRTILCLIACTSRNRPLSETALLQLLLNTELYIEQDAFRKTIDSLQAVMYRDTTKDNAIHVCHPSFLDFISTGLRSQVYWTEPAIIESFLARRCLEIMHSQLRFNICNLESSFMLNDDLPEIQNLVSECIPEHLQYSCLYWMSHFALSNLNILHQQVQDLLKGLLCGLKALYWLECLSILKSLKMGIDILTVCIKQFQPVNYIAVMCKELYRFISAYYTPVSISTPHLYLSALSWVPTESNMAEKLYPHFSNQPLVSMGKETKWKSTLWTSDAESSILCVAYSPDGRHIASGSRDNNLRIWDAQTGDIVGEPLTVGSSWVTCVAYSPDGKNIVSGLSDKTLRIWDAQTGDTVGEPLTGHSNWVTSVAYSLDGSHIVSGSSDWTLRIWDAQTGNQVGKPLTGHSGPVNSVTCSPDGRHIVSGSDDKTLRIWDTQTGDIWGKPLVGHLGCVTSVAYSYDGRHVISGSDDKTLRIWDAVTSDTVGEPLTGHSQRVTSVSYSPNGKHIVSGSYDNTIRIWDTQTGDAVGEPLTGGSGWVICVAYSPDGKNIVSGLWDKTLRIWDAQTGDVVHEPFTGHSNWVTSVAYSPDSRHIVSGSDDNTLRIWDAQTGDAVGEPLTGHSDSVCSVAYSPDGSQIVSGSGDKTLRIWDAQIRDTVGEPLTGHLDWVTSVAYSPDGRYIVSGSDDNTLRIWDAQTRDAVGRPLTGHSQRVTSVAYSPNGKHIVSGSYDKTLRIWDTQTGDAVGEPLAGHSDWVTSVAYSPDGSHIVSGSNDKTLRIWDAQNGYSVGEPLTSHSQRVRSIAYSPDGKYIVSGSDDKALRIWDAETGDVVGYPLTGHSEWVRSVAYSPDGRKIVSGSRDKTLRIWDRNVALVNYLQLLSPLVDQEHDISIDSWVRSTSGKILLWVPHDLCHNARFFGIGSLCIPNNCPEAGPIHVNWELLLKYSGSSWADIHEELICSAHWYSFICSYYPPLISNLSLFTR